MRTSRASLAMTPDTLTSLKVGSSPIDKVKVDPHRYLIFNYSKESEEWVSFVTLWNNDSENSFVFNIDYNKKNDKECFIIRPGKTGHLVRQTVFSRKVVLKVTYDPRNDEPCIRHSKEKLGSNKRAEEKTQTFTIGQLEPIHDTRRYFKLQIWRLNSNGRTELFCSQYLLPIFLHPQLTNNEVFVYPAKSITFNRNQGNQYSYWKNNFFIINNASQSVYFRILATRLPNNCDMVVFPTSGVVQHSFSDFSLQKKIRSKSGASQLESDQEMSGKHYTVVSILLLDPEKAYLTHAAQKPIATIVILYSYQKHPETENLDELLQWATGKESIEIFVRDMSHNVSAKNTVVHDKRLLELAQQNSMDKVYRLDNMVYQNVARQTRIALSSLESKNFTGANSPSHSTYTPSSNILSGNAKELISSSSVTESNEDQEQGYSQREDVLLETDKSFYPMPSPSKKNMMIKKRQGGLKDTIRKVRNSADERRITVTYGVSDSDIRQLICQLRNRGVDASRNE